MGIVPSFLAVFSSSWMLLWALAAVIPILLHLLTRQYRQEVRWAAIQFLLAAHQKAIRRFRFWQWILLALRILALILFAVALAEPFTSEESGPTAKTREPRLNIIAIDASLSMQASHNNATRWQTAIQNALSICSSAIEGDSFILIKFATQTDRVVQEISFDQEAVATTLKSLRPVDTIAAPARCIDDINDLLLSIDKDAIWNSDISVTIITDLQASNWNSVAQKTKLHGAPETTIIDVGQPLTANTFIESVEIKDRVVFANKPFTVQTSIQHHGSAPRDTLLLQLLLDGVVTESKRVAIDAGTQSVSWQATIPKGTHSLSVRTESDFLDADNQRHTIVHAREKLRLTCIGDRPESTKFVATALLSGTDGSIEVTENHDQDLRTLDSSNQDLVIICDPKVLNKSDATFLQQFIESGHSVLIWLGPNLDATSMNGVLSQFEICKIDSASEFGVYKIDPLGYQHPIVDPFRTHPNSGLLTTPIFRYWILSAWDNASTTRALDIGGSPLLIIKRFASAGHLAIFSTSSTIVPANGNEQSWNALSLWPSFIPLVQETVKHLTSRHAIHRPLVTGDTFAWPLPHSEMDRSFSLVAQNGATRTVKRATGRSVLTGPALMESGIYKLIGSDQQERGRVAVNFPLPECSTKKLDPEQLPTQFKVTPGAAQLDSINHDDANVLSSLARESNGRQWFRAVLGLLIGCLLLESVITRVMRTKFA